MCLRDTKGPVHFFIYQSPWPVSQNREIFSKPACPSLFLFIYFPELFQSVVCFPHYSFQTKSLVFLYTFLLAIPLLCPPCAPFFCPIHVSASHLVSPAALHLHPSLLSAEWGSFHSLLIVCVKNENSRHWGTQRRLLTLMGLWGGDWI